MQFIIVEIFGVDIATLDYDSKQKGLFDFEKYPKSSFKEKSYEKKLQKSFLKAHSERMSVMN